MKDEVKEWEKLETQFCRYLGHGFSWNSHAAAIEWCVLDSCRNENEKKIKTANEFYNAVKELFRQYPMAIFPNNQDPFEWYRFNTPVPDTIVEKWFAAYLKGGEKGNKETWDIVRSIAIPI